MFQWGNVSILTGIFCHLWLQVKSSRFFADAVGSYSVAKGSEAHFLIHVKLQEAECLVLIECYHLCRDARCHAQSVAHLPNSFQKDTKSISQADKQDFKVERLHCPMAVHWQKQFLVGSIFSNFCSFQGVWHLWAAAFFCNSRSAGLASLQFYFLVRSFI